VTRAADDEASTYTLRRVQAMLGLSRSIVAGLIAEGFVSPTRGRRNEWRFTFQDLMLLRTAHALQASKIPPRRILRSLARLKATLPQELPLTGLRITAIGADVAVRDRHGQWQADDGQLLMDFDVAPVAGSVTFLEHDSARGIADAASSFELGLALEQSDPAAAEAAYRQAIALAPDDEAAYLNLGAMLSEADRFVELSRLCDEALAHCPSSSLLHFNRGVALDHLERGAEAIASYEQSLALDPTLADAHFNLGRLQEQLGDTRGALRHFSAYRRLQR
jgi:tetratricopeptide (TPR) repeat protein